MVKIDPLVVLLLAAVAELRKASGDDSLTEFYKWLQVRDNCGLSDETCRNDCEKSQYNSGDYKCGGDVDSVEDRCCQHSSFVPGPDCIESRLECENGCRTTCDRSMVKGWKCYRCPVGMQIPVVQQPAVSPTYVAGIVIVILASIVIVAMIVCCCCCCVCCPCYRHRTKGVVSRTAPATSTAQPQSLAIAAAPPQYPANAAPTPQYRAASAPAPQFPTNPTPVQCPAPPAHYPANPAPPAQYPANPAPQPQYPANPAPPPLYPANAAPPSHYPANPAPPPHYPANPAPTHPYHAAVPPYPAEVPHQYPPSAPPYPTPAYQPRY